MAQQPQQGYGVPPPQYGQAPPPQYGQAPPPQYGQAPPPQQAYSQQTVVVAQPTVRVGGGCPACGGFMRDEYTVCGIILAILFFPIGILCCLMMTERRCSNCGR